MFRTQFQGSNVGIYVEIWYFKIECHELLLTASLTIVQPPESPPGHGRYAGWGRRSWLTEPHPLHTQGLQVSPRLTTFTEACRFLFSSVVSSCLTVVCVVCVYMTVVCAM